MNNIIGEHNRIGKSSSSRALLRTMDFPVHYRPYHQQKRNFHPARHSSSLCNKGEAAAAMMTDDVVEYFIDFSPIQGKRPLKTCGKGK